MKKNSTLLILGSILLFALIIRIYNLSNNPPGFFADEASIGYNAYLITQSGHDEYGVFLPSYFQSFGDYKGGVPIYLTSLFVIFGLNEFTTRLPFAIAGILSVLLIFLIGRYYVNEKFALYAALFASITLWLIHYSRIAFELNIYLTFFLLIIYLFTKIKSYPILIPVTFFITSLSLYTYRASFVQIPVMTAFLIFMYRKSLFKYPKYLAISFLVTLITLMPFIEHMINGDGLERYNQVGTLSATMTHAEKFIEIATAYLYHLTPDFLFIKGDNFFVTRHFTDGFVPLLLVFLPFLIIGLISIVKNFKSPFSLLCIVWLLIYPLSGSLTTEPPYTSRSIIGSGVLVLIITKGFFDVIEYRKKIRTLQYTKLALIFVLFFTSFTVFIRYYFYNYPLVSADFWGWQYGPKAIISYFEDNQSNYDELYMQGEFNAPFIFLEFYSPHGKCSKCNIGDPLANYNSTKKQLFAVTPNFILSNPQFQYTYKERILYPNNTVAFEMVEIVE